MTMLRPITIVGGGLTGLSLGIALRKAGATVEIFEAGDYPRHRVCGEFITGLNDDTIEKLGISNALSDAGCHHSVTWFWKEQKTGQSALPAPARALSRYTLDARLARIFTTAGGRLTVRTRFTSSNYQPGVIQTCGRKPSGSSQWFGLKLHARYLPTVDDLEFHLANNAYVGLSTVEDGWTNVCGLFRRRPGLQFDRDDALSVYLRSSGFHALAERLAMAQIRPGSRRAVAGFVFDRGISADDGVRLGDACAMIPPFTGNGMAMAFTSASLAVDPLMTWVRGEHSWDAAIHSINGMLRQEFRVRLAAASFLHPFLLNRTLQRCLGGALRAGFLPTTTLYRLLH